MFFAGKSREQTSLLPKRKIGTYLMRRLMLMMMSDDDDDEKVMLS